MMLMSLFSLLLLPLAAGLQLRVSPARAPAARMCSAWSRGDELSLHAQIAAAAKAPCRLGGPSDVLAGLKAAYVLIFNPGKFDEGVYTLQGRAAQSPAYVLAFEADDEAHRFAQLLQAEGFDLATCCRWEPDQLTSFCDMGAFEVSLVPSGALITPPVKNEYDLDAFERLDATAAPYAERARDGRGQATKETPWMAHASYLEERARFERIFKA